MSGIELLRIIWINMIQNKYKVLLTSLGIIVGTVTIVLVIAIGQGGEKKAADQYSYLSADTIYMNPNFTVMGFGTDSSKLDALTPEVVDKIKEESNTLQSIYMRQDTFKDMVINGEKTMQSLYGVTDGYVETSNLYVQYGGDLSQEDMEQELRVAVLGYKIAEKYFDQPYNAIGNKIKIGDYQYVIVGVLEKSGDGLQGMSSDDAVIIPYTSMIKDGLSDSYSIPSAVGKVSNIKHIPKTMREIKSSLNYYLDNGELYTIDDAGSRIEAATESARMMSMLLMSVAVIVFIVGGIGIMNVLFVTIKERTREIGVLKALGTSNVDIMKQFLLESAGIGIFGGLVGIALSYVAIHYLGTTDIPVLANVEGKVIAFLFAVATSTIFGFYPAYKASMLKPVDALNQE